jgi:hypothetical protein
MTKNEKIHYGAIAVFFTLLAGSSWIALGQFDPWILSLTVGGVLLCIGITIYRKRTGSLG